MALPVGMSGWYEHGDFFVASVMWILFIRGGYFVVGMIPALHGVHQTSVGGSPPEPGPGEGPMASYYTNGSTGHKGHERRKLGRRNVADRRKDIRWEPNNPNR